MKQYIYCQVQPKGMTSVFSYLSHDEIKIGSYVEIPFGAANKIIKGVVLDVVLFSEDNVPVPIERIKYITRTITKEEYEKASEDVSPYRGTFDWYEALEEICESIEGNDYDAIFEWAYNHGDYVDSPAIMEKVVECYEICVEQNNPTAALNLGTMYYTGHGVAQDYKEAAKYYEIAAAAGEVRALCNLGYCWYYGRHAAVDYEKAYHCFSLGALLHNDANCLYKLGDMFDTGKYVIQNKKYAFQLYVRAMQAVDPNGEDQFCEPDIRLRIGTALLEGDVVEQDVPVAFELLSQALSGFYRRRKTDPFAKGLITSTKKLIEKAEAILDNEVSNSSPSTQEPENEVMGSIRIVSDGIVETGAEAVVNAANSHLRHGTGVCDAVFKAAGPRRLQEACNFIGRCEPGDAVVTPAFDLPGANIIIHAVGPKWNEDDKAPELLYNAYIRALQQAKNNGCRTIAFPLISNGVYGCPLEKAWQVGLNACTDFLSANPSYPLEIRFSVPNQEKRQVGEDMLRALHFGTRSI